MRIGRTLGIVALGTLATTALAWGSQRAISLEKLCARAQHIVIGTVTQMSCYEAAWPKVGTIPFTDVTIEVAAEWKGKLPGNQMVLQVPGGKHADGTIMVVTETPRFRIGEKVLVFTTSYNGRQWVYGWEQGKYEVVLERVVGKKGFPIPEDVLTYPLKRQITTLVDKASPPPKKGQR